MKDFLLKIYFVSLFIPYFNPVDFGTDTSVLPLFLGFFNIVFRYKFNLGGNKSNILLIFLLLTFATFALMFNYSLINLKYYTGIICLSIAIIIISKDRVLFIKFIEENLYKIITLWVVFLIFQIVASFIGFDFQEVLSSIGFNSSRTTENRGFNSLAPEPSYLGFFACTIYFVTRVFPSIKKRKFVAMCSLILIFSSVSFTPISLFFIAFFTPFLIKLNIEKLFLGCVLFLSLFYFIDYYQTNIRFFSLLIGLLDSPELFLVDLSSASRIASIILGPLLIFSEYFLLGASHLNYYETVSRIFPIFFSGDSLFYLLEGASAAEKIKSSYSAIIYFTGFVGIIFYLSNIKMVFKSKKNKLQLMLFIFLAFLVQVPFTTMLYPTLFYLKKNDFK